LLDIKREKEIAQSLGLANWEVAEIRKKIQMAKKRLDVINTKVFKFGDMSTAIGIYKGRRTTTSTNNAASTRLEKLPRK
jgi:hypothetical protein